MSDYTVRARFEADASGYIQAVNAAKQATEGLGDSADKAGKQTGKAFEGVDKSVSKTGTSAEQASKKTESLGTSAQGAGTKAEQAFAGVADGIDAAGISLDGVAGKYTDLGNTASVAVQKATQGIRDHSQEITQAGATITTIGAGWAALNTTMMATGIQYNTLQQVASKSMQTMMGSIEGANMQMERFHAFADESPFSRATFLEAQRQLMAFGMEADRVVPSLEGIQNAVAAIGGGNTEIMQLTDILGAIQGQGKITGRELQRMGQMGIDAADIIGEQMGKSGAAIRDEITAGTLDAETAIEALTTGMAIRFDGAAAGLKETFEGAIDRVKAAFRDLSGESFEWAVGSEGGGLLVDLANAAADAMRAIQQLPGPVKNAMGIIGTLGSTATVAAGGFMLLAPRAVETWDAFVKLSNATGATALLENIRSKAPAAATALRNVGKFAGIAATALVAMKVAGEIFTRDQVYDIEDMAEAVEILSTNASSAAIDRLFSDFATMKLPGVKQGTEDITDLESAMARLAEPRTTSEKINQWADQAFAWTGAAQSDLTQIEKKVTDFGDSLAGMVQEGNIEGAAAAFQVLADAYTDAGGEVEDLTGLMPSYIESLMNTAEAAGVTITEQEALQWALSGVAPAAVEAAGGLEAIEGAADDLDGTLDGVISKLQQMGLVERNATEAMGALHEAIRDANDSLQEHGQNLDVTTQAGYENHQALNGIAESALAAAEAQLELGASGTEVADTMRTGYDAIVETAQAMGASAGEADELARSIMGIEDKDVSIDTYFDETAREMAIALANEIEAIPEHKIIGIAAQEDGSFVSVQQKVDDLGNTVTVIVDAEGNAIEVTEEIQEINGHEITVYVDDDGTIYQVEQDLEEISKLRPQSTIEVDADTSGAKADIAEVEDTDATATIDTDADTSDAESSIEGITARDWATNIIGIPEMANAEDSANTTARQRNTPFVGVPNMGDAESTANKTARERRPYFTGVPQMGVVEDTANRTARERKPQFTGIANVQGAEGSLNNTARDRNASINASKGSDGVSGWLSRLTTPRTVTITAVGTGAGGALAKKAHGGVASSTHGVGHYQDVLPRRAGGGRLPYTGLGTDMILARNRHGVPTAWVDDGEWVIREQMSRKYHQALGLINADHPAIHHLAGLADGGQTGRTRLANNYLPMVSSGLVTPSGQGPVELSAGSIQALARAVQPFLVVDNQVIAQANGSDARQATLAGRY